MRLFTIFNEYTIIIYFLTCYNTPLRVYKEDTFLMNIYNFKLKKTIEMTLEFNLNKS